METSTFVRTTPYPVIEPYGTDGLAVSDIHELYYEQCGNPAGKPVLYLHGGPGSGSRPNDRTFFDPEVYRIVILDQRGSGKSTPAAELRENTTWDLVEDIEKLRTHLGIDRWVVFGCSWGSTLALAYAETHPDRVKALVIGGIFASQRHEITWVNQSGAHALFPDVWEEYIRPIPELERYDLVSAYYRRLTGKDEKIKLECARAWTKFEIALSKLNIGSDPPSLPPGDDTGKWDIQCASIEWLCGSWQLQQILGNRLQKSYQNFTLNHYFVHGGFLQREDQLLADAHKIRHIPTTIVHGRYDLVCPLETAWKLHKELPEADFHIIPNAGHSKTEPGSTAKLVEACEKYKHL